MDIFDFTHRKPVWFVFDNAGLYRRFWGSGKLGRGFDVVVLLRFGVPVRRRSGAAGAKEAGQLGDCTSVGSFQLLQ